MPREHFGNEYSTTLSDAITFNQTTIRVADASGFPPVHFRVRIGNEILRVYAALSDLQSFTVERGAEGTNPNAHAADSSVTLVLTADALETFIKDGYTEVPWGAPDAPGLAFNAPLSDLDWEYDETVRPHGFFFEMVDGEPQVGISVGYVPKARWTLEGQLLHGDLIFEGEPYDGGPGQPEYPHGIKGALRLRGDFTGEGTNGPPDEQARTAFTTIHPFGYAIGAIYPQALGGFNAYSAWRAYDTPNFNINTGSYIEIGANRQKTWLQTAWRANGATVPGDALPPVTGRPFEIRYNSHVYMEFGVNTGTSNAIGIGVGRTPHPNVWSLSVYGGINLGPTILGAGNGSLYAEGSVLGTSVRWGPNYHRTELLTDFQADIDSGFYWAAAATSPPVAGTYHVVGTRKHDEARHGLLAIRDNGFGDIFVTADGWRDNLNNPRWVKLWNTGNLPGSLTGNGILDGPIGIGPGSNLTGKVAGDFVVERSITLANEPGAAPGEFRSGHGWIVGDGTWHGLKKSGGAVLTPAYARAGGQTSSDGVRGAAWLSYGGYPGEPPFGFPFRRGYGDGGSISVAWRLGQFSEIDDEPIIAELLFNAAGSTNFVWRNAIRIDQNGGVIFGRVDGEPPAPGEGGMTVSGPLNLPGPLIISRNTAGIPENVHLKIWQQGYGDALFEMLSANNDVRLVMSAGASRFLIGVENAADEFVIVANGTTFPDSPPDRRVLRIGTAGGAAFGIAPTANYGDLSIGRGLNVGSTATGAADGVIRSLMYSPGVNNGSGMVYRQHVWASAAADGKTNLNLGFNVYGQNEAALTRQDTTKPSWYMRMGEQDAFSILRAAPGAGSDWELLLTLDDEGNLVGNNLGTLLSFINVGAALDAVLGEIRMIGSLYLAQNSLAPSNDQQIMVEVPAGGRDYVPLFRAEGDGHWWFGGAGDDGILEMRVGGPTGQWRVSNADGSLPILRTNNAGIMEARYSLSVGAFTGGDELAPNNWLYAYSGIRTGNGSLSSPVYSFRGTAPGGDHQKTGLFYLDAGVNVGVVSSNGSVGLHRVALFAHPVSSIRSHLLPTLPPTEGPPPKASYDLGATDTAGWRAGYFWNGLVVGSTNTAEAPVHGQLRVISNGGADDEIEAYEPQVIAKFIDNGTIDPSDEAKPRETYRAEIQIGGSGHPVDTLMRIGTTFQSTLLQGFENTNAYEGRPAFYFERNRGPVIWGVDGERHIQFSESGSVGIGNVTPTNNLGDLIVARGLTVGLTNAGLIQAGEIIGPAEGEILATSITISGTFIVGTGSSGTTQFNTPIILQNNVKIRGRAAQDTPAGIESGTIWDLFWLGNDDELVIQGLPENRVHIKAMTNGPGTPTAVQALTIWPNAGVTIGTWGPGQPPGQSGLKIAGNFEIGGTFIVQDTTRFWANVYNNPLVPAIGAGMLGDDVARIAFLAGGTLVFGTGNGTWLGSIDHTTSGRLQLQEYLGINLDPAYRLDVREQAASVFAGRISNAADDGHGLAVFAGDTDSEIAFVVRKYNQRPNIGAFPAEDTADGLFVVYGSGMTGIAGGLFVQDPAQPDPILQAEPGQIVCENIIVRQDTRYGYGPGGSGQTEVGAAGIVLGNNIPLQVREYTGTSTPGTARSVLWIDTSNILHLRGAHTAGFRIESSAGTVAISVGNAGSVAIGAATPTANAGDLSVYRGVNVGTGVTGAINGQVKALSAYFGGNVEITGTLTAPSFTITAVDAFMVGGPTGATSGQLAANQLIAQPDGANPIPSTFSQQFGAMLVGPGVASASIQTTIVHENLLTGAAALSRQGSLYLHSTTTGAHLGGGVFFGAWANGAGDAGYAGIRGLVFSPTGVGIPSMGAIAFYARTYPGDPISEVMRITGNGVGIGRIPIASAAGRLDVAGHLTVGQTGMFSSSLQADGVFTANAGALIGPVNHRGWIGQGSLYVAEFVTSLTSHGVRSVVPTNSALYLYDGSTPSGQRFLVWANGDMWLERGLNVGTAGAARPAVAGEIHNTGPMDWTYQASAPATPSASHLKWWFDTRGAPKITRPSGEQWFVDVKESHVYNSDFDLWQRGTTFAGLTSSQYTADRWYVSINVGALTVSRTANSVPLTAAVQGGHHVPWVLRAQSTVVVADGAILSASLVGLRYSWEGRFWARVVGRPNVFSCWVRSDRTMLYSVAFRSGNFGRYFVQTFTIAAANTWQYVWFVIPAPTVLTDFNYDHTLGAEAWFILAAGTTSKGATVGAWTAGALLASSSQGNMLNTLNSYLEIAHVKIESGEVPTPCLGRPWDQDLRHAQRYYVKTFPYDVVPASNAGAAGALNTIMTNSAGAVSWRFPVPMRTTPTTISTYNPTSSGSNWNNSVVAAIVDQSADGLTITGTLAAANGLRPEIHAAAHADF